MRRISIVVAACLAADTAAAQMAPELRLGLGAGTVSDIRGVRSGAVTLAPTVLLHPGAGWRVTLGGTGAAFDHGGWSAGASAGIEARARLLPALTLRLDGAAAATATSARTTVATLAGAPTLEFGLSRLTLFGGFRAARGWTARPVADDLLPPFNRRTRESRTAAGPVIGGELRLPTSGGGLAIGYREERLRLGAERLTDRSVSASLQLAGTALGTTATLRDGSVPAERAIALSAAFSLSPRLWLELGAGSQVSDRLLAIPGGRYLTAGIGFRWGGGPRPLPRPTGVPAPARGITRIAIEAPRARTVEIAGDWDGWRPVPATRAANGVWYVDLSLPAGVYRYAFRIDHKEWRVPDGAPARDDGFGGKSAWLVVAQPEHTTKGRTS
ncbi:MAG TPA: glycogen-binding domain-containing protein [Gemmatimonadales bacterium]|nr:glycogen-binding domain-containing protein [Gemmatimonadales bacterium]